MIDVAEGRVRRRWPSDKEFKRTRRSLQGQEGVRAETNDMNGTSVIEVGRPAIRRRTLRASLRGGLKGGEYYWAVAFVVAYIAGSGP